jgi:shikimate kinase
MLPTRIYLTGFMGSGKSTVGPLLARALGYRFLDLDTAIVQQAGQPIPQLFSEEGEAGFRQRETEALRSTGQQDRMVIALGGGALTFEHNLQWARENGLVLYLRVPADGLVRRLLHSGTERPLLADDPEARNPEVLQRKVEDLLARREPFYTRAHITVEAGGKSVSETVIAVLSAIQEWQSKASE